MEGMSAFQSQLSSIMERLVVSAVTEINQLMCEYFAVLRTELSGETTDSSPLKGTLQLHRPTRDFTQHGSSDAGVQTQVEEVKSGGTTEEQDQITVTLVDCKVELTPVPCDDHPEVQPSLRVALPATCPQPTEFRPHPAGQSSQFCSNPPEGGKDLHTDHDPSVEMQGQLSLSPSGAQLTEQGFHIKREVESPDVQTQDEGLSLGFEFQHGTQGQSCSESGTFPVDSTLPDAQVPTFFSSLQPSENHHGLGTSNMLEPSSRSEHAAAALIPRHQFGRRTNAQYQATGGFVCDFCGKTFLYMSAMKGHRLTHTRERSHVCGHCGKTFIRRSHLNRHEIQHVGIKQFICEVCGYRFFRRAHVLSHMKTHHRRTKESRHVVEEAPPTQPLNCFICQGPDKQAQRLVLMTPKGYPTFLKHTEAANDAALMERMQKARREGRLRYHVKCRTKLYNRFRASKEEKVIKVEEKVIKVEEESLEIHSQ